MAELKLTPAQRGAVEDRGGALLVSAAAGSGKTKVLVDRLMSYVCDPDSPRDINEFLIITYTRAAASELRGKISAELSRRLTLKPGDRRLQRQLGLVYMTAISTVHAFCADLLRAYAHVLDLPSDFRVAEESESAALLARSLEETLEEAYPQMEDDAELRAMADVLGAGRDDEGAGTAAEALYRAARCHPDPNGWLDRCARTLDMDQYAGCETTPWGAELIAGFHDFVRVQLDALGEALDEMAGVTEVESAYGPVFAALREQLTGLAGLNGWDEIGAAIPETQPRLKAVRRFEDKQFLERMKGVRTRCLDGLKGWRSVFSTPSAEGMDELAQTAAALRGAVRLARRLGERFAAGKARRKLLDFSDLEHETIRLLTDRYTGEPTAAAREIAARYAEVLVDEYQDSNELQERIFNALSQEGRNRFLVGDVKQSIYRFRLADPSLFLEKYRTFAPREEAAEGEPRKLLLSENFRSRPEILEAVNDVFRAVMSEETGGLRYGDGEALKPGRPFPETSEPVVELHCLPSGGEDGETDKGRTEARFVAGRIAELLTAGTIDEGNGPRPVRPEDIVILLRSVGPAAGDYIEALRERNIPCVSDRGESVLDSEPVEVFLAILQMIDNPHRDIPLTAALLSPVFCFTADELAQIRADSRTGDLYGAVRASEDGKAEQFRDWLDGLREEARWLPLHTLLRRVYDETGIEGVYGARENGAERRGELRAFFAYASACAADGSATLARFLAQTEEQRQRGSALAPETMAAGGAVRILSIHKSKGLEFPVVFLAGLSRRFNVEDERRQVLIHPELLAAASALDMERGVRYPTFARRAIAARIRRENLSEEMRVLYVAMTRAQHRLIMTYCARYLFHDLSAVAMEAGCPVSPDFAGRARNPGWWVLNAALLGEEAVALHEAAGKPRLVVKRRYPWRVCLHDGVEDTEVLTVPVAEAETELPLPDEAELERRLGLGYPHRDASRVPSKLTATALKGRALDREALEWAEPLPPRPSRSLRQPAFLTGVRPLTPTERGSANHLFLQFARYEACTERDALEGEIRRMVGEEFLTPEQAGAVEREQILRLFTSPLGEKLLHGEVRREFKFSLLVDAEIYDSAAAGEQIMLQGVADCLILEPDGLTVVDFKTDRVAPGGETERAAVYHGQLRAYAMAVGRIFGKPVQRCVLFFLKTGAEVEVEM